MPAKTAKVTAQPAGSSALLPSASLIEELNPRIAFGRSRLDRLLKLYARRFWRPLALEVHQRDIQFRMLVKVRRGENLKFKELTQTEAGASMDFIRLLFIDPVEEQVAHRWALRLATLIGPQALQLRPETTLAQMLDWAAATDVDSMDFVVVFEPELRMEFGDFLDCPEHATFREMVEHYANRFGMSS